MNIEEYNKKIDLINQMDDKILDNLINHGKCPYPSELLIDVPMGMFHCPICGKMTVAGTKHSNYYNNENNNG